MDFLQSLSHVQEKKVENTNQIVFQRGGIIGKIKILPNCIVIEEDSNITSFNGGTDEYDIKQTITIIKRKKKTIQVINIEVRKKMYITPILGIALNEKEQKNLKMDIRVGYALNKHTILMKPHYKYNLHPVYYWVIPSIRTVQCVTQFDVYFEFSFYLSVKINDNRFMSEEKKQDLLDIFTPLHI